jgi:DNA-binding NarL/FixJ family response regulator
MRTLILSMYENEQFLFEALKAGASGYVLKSEADQDIADACRAAMRGHSFLYPSALDALMRDTERANETGTDFELLPPRELEVLKLIAEGHSSKQIADSSSSASRQSAATAPTCSTNSTCATAST